jgi:DNA processing protein
MHSVQEFKPEMLFSSITEIEEKHKPEQLYALGNIDLLTNAPKVSVVGSRKVSEEGSRRARSISKTIVENRLTVVSGMALGVDTVAHTTAIECGGNTIAVLGTPLDNPYPKQNTALFELIARDHLAISQFSSGYPNQSKNFPMRNRTMALISDATIIIEAGEKSGTRYQGWEALRLGRLLFLLESVANNPVLTWPAEMIKYGAQVLTRDNLDELVENLPQFNSRMDIDF